MEKLGGYKNQVLRVDLTNQALTEEPLNEHLIHDFIGGRGFGAKLLYDELKQGTDPLGEESKLIFCTGPLAGTNAQCVNRWKVMFKSPLTGTYGMSSCGGHWAPEIKFAGFDAVVVSAVRIPFGKFGGILKDIPSIELGAMVIKEVLRRVNVKGEEVEETYYGTAFPAEVALETDVPARQATLKAGMPPDSISLTIDRACCSSLAAVRLGFRAIKAGEIEVALGVGAENMSRTPYMAPDIRWGKRLGHIQLLDGLFELGYKEFNPVSVDAGEVALEYGITREDQDRWAYESQIRYARAFSEGKFKIGEELMRVEIPQGKGPPIILERDEFPKPDTTLEKLSGLPLVYGSPTVTAGNAPGLDTGASAILIMSEKKAKEKGLKPLVKIISMIATATTPRLIAAIPGFTIRKALEKAQIDLDQIDLIEINEAFAAMPLVSIKILGEGDPEKMRLLLERTNVNGGAIAIGHPVGASGARILMTLIYELRRRGGGIGVASICGGLSQGEGAVVQVESE